MDPIEEMLVKKYRIDPAQAKSLAQDVKAGIGDAAANKNLKTEVVTDAANTELGRLKSMEQNANEFARLHAMRKRIEAGTDSEADAMTPEQADWYNNIIDTHRKNLANRAAASTAARTSNLESAADTELNRMAAMTDYANSFKNGFTTQQLAPNGSAMVPKSQPQYNWAQKSQAANMPTIELPPITLDPVSIAPPPVPGADLHDPARDNDRLVKLMRDLEARRRAANPENARK